MTTTTDLGGWSTFQKSIHGLSGIVVEAELQRFLSSELPEWVSACEFGAIDAGMVSLELAKTHFPPMSIRWMELTGRGSSVPLRERQKCILRCEIKSGGAFASQSDPTMLFQLRHKIQIQITGDQVQESDLFLIGFIGVPEVIAVIPATHLTRGRTSTMVLDYLLPTTLGAKPGNANTIFQPYMVHRPLLAGFLRKLFHHAESGDKTPIQNPTTGVTYSGFFPSLGNASLLLSNGSDAHKESWNRVEIIYRGFNQLDGEFRVIQNLHQPWLGDFFLVTCDERVHKQRDLPKDASICFEMEHKFNYWSRDGNIVRIIGSRVDRIGKRRLTFPYGASWHYIILECSNGHYSLCIPRDRVRKEWWGGDFPELWAPLSEFEDLLVDNRNPVEVARHIEKIVIRYKFPQREIPRLQESVLDLIEIEPSAFPDTATWEGSAGIQWSGSLWQWSQFLHALLRKECRRRRWGIIVPLHGNHPRGDLYLAPYHWSLSDCKKFDGDPTQTFSPLRPWEIPKHTPILLITLLAMPPLSDELRMRINNASVQKIQKGLRGSLVFVLPGPGGDWDEMSYAILPPSELKHPRLTSTMEKIRTGKITNPGTNAECEFALTSHPRTYAAFIIDQLRIHKALQDLFEGSNQLGAVTIDPVVVMATKQDLDQIWVEYFQKRPFGQVRGLTEEYGLDDI